MTNGSTTPRVDAEWAVNFALLGRRVRTRFSFIGTIAAAVAGGGLALWASDVEGVASGTLLATCRLPLVGTGGQLQAAFTDEIAVNPGGHKFVVLTSFAGADALGAPIELTYDKHIIADMVTA